MKADMTPYKEEIIEHLSNLIKIPSVRGESLSGMPFGKECYRALEYMLNLAQSMGFETENADGYAGHVDFGSGDEIIGILVHLDVVPAGTGWTVEPFGGVISDGKIYGRGADDDKGPAVAALYALKFLKDAGIVPKKKVRLIFGCGEETGMEDMDYYFSKYPVPKMGFSPDCGYPITNREKSILNVTMSKDISDGDTFGDLKLLAVSGGSASNIVPEKCNIDFNNGKINKDGISAHASTPELGENAFALGIGELCSSVKNLNITPLEKFINFLNDKIGMETDGKSLGIACSDDVSGSLTLNLGILDYLDGTIYAKLDIRVPVECDVQPVIDTLTEVCSKNNINFLVEGISKANNVPDSHPMIGALKKAYKEITGEECDTQAIGGGTYARTLGGNGVGFGGAGGSNYHSADEFVPIDSLMRHADICAQAIYELIELK